MKKMLLVLSLVLSMFLVACGSEAKEVKQETTSESSTIEKEETVEKEVKKDVEEETEEDKTLFDIELDITDNSSINSKITKDKHGKIYINQVVQSEDINELAACFSFCLKDLYEYSDNDNVNYSIQCFSLNVDNLSPYIQYSNVLGTMAIEEDGTTVNDIPQWVINADIKAIDITNEKKIVDNLTYLFEKESEVVQRNIE